jgi:isochorismate hydrolase
LTFLIIKGSYICGFYRGTQNALLKQFGWEKDNMLHRNNSVLLIVDIQGNLAQTIDNREFVFENIRKIIRGGQALEIPVVLIEQVNLGATIPEVRELIPSVGPIIKESFSCCRNKKFMETLVALQRKQILICGIEAHVCIYQTSAELITRGYEVHVVADAVSSRTAMNREIALQKMADCGAGRTTTEMALYELLGTAADPKLRDIVRIVK